MAFKARLGAKGFHQRLGVDYHDTFSPMSSKKLRTAACSSTEAEYQFVASTTAEINWEWVQTSLYDCTAEFRFFWLNSKLAETGACDSPSRYHKFRFSSVPVFNCDQSGLYAAYTGVVSYVKDGLLFYNKYAHYQTGNTPLALVWKDEHCSQYVIDTDSKGDIPSQQQVVLELQDDGKLSTSDDPAVNFGCLDREFIQKSELHSGSLLKFAIGDGGLSFVDGKLEKADLHYLGKTNRARMFADSYSKVIFQYMVRHAPLKFDDLLASISSSNDQENKLDDVEMVG
ncbi:uncharacterized protein LOC116129398 [Pistacia vera]|uniref:uncharacterized protein LOC116129398 n=1 Tax=Pistacia vera TaxID=55513 RepID=UPI001263B081|nr:uncharacterized protein LOC116129398 [Pistacia vera]